MIKKILVLVLLLCLVGCKSNDDNGMDKVMSNVELSDKAFNETLYGHKNKDKKNAMSVDEAFGLIKNVGDGAWYDEIEYYGVVKFAPGDVQNDYYAFLATLDNDNYYILVDIYNGVTTFVNDINDLK